MRVEFFVDPASGWTWWAPESLVEDGPRPDQEPASALQRPASQQLVKRLLGWAGAWFGVRQPQRPAPARTRSFSLRVLVAVLLLVLVGMPPAQALAASPDQPTLVVGRVAAATFEGGRPFHGAGGDELLLFAVQPTPAPDGPQGVLVANRITGRQLGTVTPPSNGWRVPLS